MIELVRIVESQATLYSFKATQHEKSALMLESLIEMTKPRNVYSEWHPLIATPFRYHSPHEARFRLPYGKNIFYGSLIEETALYEHAFHFMKQRAHLSIDTETGSRTLFFVNADATQAIHIKNEINSLEIIDKNNYAASHKFIAENPLVPFIFYPSCRDPQNRDNAAILNINFLAKNPHWESTIKFFYNNELQQIFWLDYQLHIEWAEVA